MLFVTDFFFFLNNRSLRQFGYQTVFLEFVCRINPLNMRFGIQGVVLIGKLVVTHDSQAPSGNYVVTFTIGMVCNKKCYILSFYILS